MSAHTVKELIERLQALVAVQPELADQQVVLEGCDCEGDWDGRAVPEKHGYVLLTR